ncbi:MAG TPA: hypothetical protein QF753_17225, partial [Victivallales bacterium]|nr:hypothetical protein [Victivallales bacterium]
SVKLAHTLLKKMVLKGLLNVQKLNSRRWEYFLTSKGITEKVKLTYEFLEFSMQFYHEARKKSSQVCKEIADQNIKNIGLIGTGDLAEIVYLGIKEWNLNLTEVFDNSHNNFLGHNVISFSELSCSSSDNLIVCMYDKSHPMTKNYLPEVVRKVIFENNQFNKLIWIF